MRARRRLHELLEVAGPQDRASRACDVFLVGLISANVLAALVESLPGLAPGWRLALRAFDDFSVAIFVAEYAARAWSVVESPDGRFRGPVWGRLRWAVTPMALVDLAAILPALLAAFGTVDLRFLRVLRVLRILKLSHYFSALDVLLEVIRVERQVFGAAFFLLVVGMLFASSGIYVFEHEAQPDAFGSIPAAMWWAVATLTTVGYGDVTPITAGGRIFGASITVLGVGMVALPTGILASGFTAELRRRRRAYAAEVRRAMADGVIDADERRHLDAVRDGLGLHEEDLEPEPGDARRRWVAGAARDLAVAFAGTDKCPHCGGSLDDPAPEPVPPRPAP